MTLASLSSSIIAPAPSITAPAPKLRHARIARTASREAKETSLTVINSVLGPCDTADLGFTLVHEHLLIGWAGWQWDNQFKFDRKAELAKAVDMLQELKGLGVGTFVDPCPMDIGRDPEFMAEASDRSGMRIIGSTGLYHHEMGIPAQVPAVTTMPIPAARQVARPTQHRQAVPRSSRPPNWAVDCVN